MLEARGASINEEFAMSDVMFADRTEIPERYRWDLTELFADDEAFLSACEAARAYPARYAAFKGTLASSPARLLEFLKFDDEVGVAVGRMVEYAQRRSDEDTRVSRYQGFCAQALSIAVDVRGASSFFASEILSLDDETMERFYAQEPDLLLYRRFLDTVFRKRAHVLPPAEEELLARAGEMAASPDNIFSLFNDADLTFDDAVDSEGAPHPVTHGTFVSLLMSSDRVLRESAFKSLYARYGRFRNTCAAVLAAQAKQLKFFADARSYPSALAASLDETEVPIEVYGNLIDTVHRNMDPMHRYVELRRDLLGVDELHFWDLHVPLFSDIDMKFTYEEACDLMLEALAPLGEDYLAIVRRAVGERWIDVYENPGKRSGAYSARSFGTHPVMLLNFQGTLDDVFTLVHEVGHSVHTYLSQAAQPSRYADYVIFVAEVASTCNEALLMHHLLSKTSDPAMRAYLLNHYLDQFKSTLYRQTMFAEFELAVGELAAAGEPITAEVLCERYRALNERYFGPAACVDDDIALEWARIPHFYYDYYVYQYATGFSAATALSRRILDEGEPAVRAYKEFLSGGCSKPPIELLRGAGVDMASPEPIEEALGLFDSMVDELAELARELKGARRL